MNNTKFRLVNNTWKCDTCVECCSDCSSYCGLDCPLDFEASCDRCEFKDGEKYYSRIDSEISE